MPFNTDHGRMLHVEMCLLLLSIFSTDYAFKQFSKSAPIVMKNVLIMLRTSITKKPIGNVLWRVVI